MDCRVHVFLALVRLACALSTAHSENLEFWLEVKEFQRRWDATEDQAVRDKDVEWMIAEFLTEGGPRQVCIGDKRVQEVLDGAKGNYTRDMFSLPEDIAYGTLKLDIFMRFEETEEGKNLFDTRDDLIELVPRKASCTGESYQGPVHHEIRQLL